ncbi:CCR4-NOT transcription complex subunit 10 [Heracleum sosnowskyi]|uniref:CCR4-NOT transcription complex subunit 10 n=1 Tax=Heracleum sosnowskyi TaxID=360622 RepID=A0AAD8ISV7_9APIA|nr:CCR4-NOT transcription complex subunit 10 [Heracleum sosnowskyi]
MDSREASTLITSNNSDDDSSLSFTYAWAKEAALLFQTGNFSDCLKLLSQLLRYKPADPKVLHNIAVVENFEDGFSNPKKFIEVLNDVKKRSEELASASVESLEGVSNSESNVVAVSNGNSSLAPQSSAANNSKIVQNAEFSTHVASFNIAVTWFNLCEYSKSFSILEPVYQKVAPISEGIALRICLLLLDGALLSHHALRSAEVIDYVEKISCVTSMINQGENVSHAQLQPLSLVTKSSSVPNSTPIPDISSGDSGTNTSEISLSRSLSEEAEYENLFSAFDMSGQNLSRPSILHSLNDISRTQVDDSFPITDLRLKLHLYKVRFLLLTRNPKAAKREVKMAMNIARGNNSMVLFLKAQLEYARGNHPKAIKLLMASSNRTEIGTSIMFYNNLGCIHYQLGKYQTSALYFCKALSISSAMRKEKPRTHTSLSPDKWLRVTYNCGMQYLACGKPMLAARCFHKASLVSYNRPLLWLRIAECCLMALEKGLLDSDGDSSSRSEVNVHVVGKGKWRHLVMEDRVSRNSQAGFVGREDSLIRNDKQPKLSMSLARQCLLNALQLLNSSESVHLSSGLPSDLAIEEKTYSKFTNYTGVSGGDSQEHNMAVVSDQVANGELKEPKSASILNATLQNSISDYEDMCRKEIQIIRQSVLADLAYVELELGNPLKALATARTLLNIAECSKIYIYLGNVFAAEALCLLNRSKEAAEHLLIYLSSGNSVEHPFTQEDCELWWVGKIVECEESNGGSLAVNNASVGDGQVFALNPEEARGTLYADLATISAIQGDLEQANRFASLALAAIPKSPEAILTAIYLDLMSGKSHEAVKKLKNCCRVSFLDGSFSVKGAL